MTAHVIRPFRPADAEALSALTLAAIRLTGLQAYAPQQVAAWASRHSLPQRFIASAAQGDAIWVAADRADSALAYALLEPDGHIDALYCHPDHSRRGLAAALLAKAEAQARMAGTMRLYTEASEIARPVFARAGYVLLARRDFAIGHEGRDIMIHNYAMGKRLD